MGLARVGKAAEVAEALKAVKPLLRNTVYLCLVTAQMKVGDMEAAKKTIGSLPEDFQSTAWSMVVSRQLQNSDFKGAKQSLAMVKELARADRLYLDVCFAQLQAGDLGGAAATAQEMAGQSQELPAYNLVAGAMIKKGDEAAARALRRKISPALRGRAERELPQILVLAAAEAGDGKRAAGHLAELPVKERNYSHYLAVAVAQRKSRDDAGYRQNIKLAKAAADAPQQQGYRAGCYRQLAYRMALDNDVDEAVKLAQQLPHEKEQSQALAGVVNGCVQAGLLERGWAAVKLIPVGSERAGAAAAAAYHSVRKGETARLGEWIDALPGSHERAQACLSAGEAYIPAHTLE